MGFQWVELDATLCFIFSALKNVQSLN
ncbi:uncharacterized protein METZ01_LOCUS280856, partial [marine metagenome]